MIFWVLLSAAGAVQLCALAAAFTGRLPRHQVDGLMAIGQGLVAIAGVVDHDPGALTLSTGLCAYYAHRWWRGGGGDGTRRRLRALRRAFTAVRRTAPAPT